MTANLRAEFACYDADNPHIWRLFVRFAHEALAVGRVRISVALIVERIRWENFVVTKSYDEFKINNNHRAFYARKWAATYPVHARLFAMRSSAADKEWESQQ